MKRWIRQVLIGEVVRCWTTGLLRSLYRKCMCSVIQFCVLAGNVQNILREHKLILTCLRFIRSQSVKLFGKLS